VATDVLAEYHKPPVEESMTVAVPPPAQAIAVPVMATGASTTFTVAVVVADPQLRYTE